MSPPWGLPRRILITGAGGFVGRHLEDALAARYPDATLLTDGFDLRDAGAVAEAVRSGRPDVCVHLAGITTVAGAREDEAQAWAVNLHGTLAMARAILCLVPTCSLIFASTADAYGGAQGAINEDVPLAPRNLYAATKAAADLALGAMATDGLRVVRVRPFNHTGPGQSSDLVVAAFARQVARIAAGLQAPVLEVGNLESWRDFLDVRDVCTAYLACIDRRDEIAPGTILNIGSGVAHRIGDILAELIALGGVQAEVRAATARIRNEDAHRAYADTTRARSLLGWRPAIEWAETLRTVLDDWRARVAQ